MELGECTPSNSPPSAVSEKCEQTATSTLNIQLCSRLCFSLKSATRKAQSAITTLMRFYPIVEECHESGFDTERPLHFSLKAELMHLIESFKQITWISALKPSLTASLHVTAPRDCRVSVIHRGAECLCVLSR